jgi:hypothetical protein
MKLARSRQSTIREADRALGERVVTVLQAIRGGLMLGSIMDPWETPP